MHICIYDVMNKLFRSGLEYFIAYAFFQRFKSYLIILDNNNILHISLLTVHLYKNWIIVHQEVQ